ncbi:TRAP transporter small permease subunit [Thalassobaculum sp. OXR-137]|uniref:TRAP transporter small permease subunit n=1 Tax=Thalassobaculum sp. OXR-137 TaxID=3100173 RepID=UPI002AC97BB8|nr:TRAP transporter small permease subunit [Thalassobaculum sp. OXR-137]WPZ33329.1 TRAP transporter small permease subunit [Thalassobaculum sp. OXR-137]
MGALLSVAGLLDGIARWIGKTIGWIMIPLILVIIFDVITRKLDFTRLLFAEYTATSGYSVSTILQDLQWHFHAALLMLSFGFGYLANAHVRVDVFRELLPRRPQAWIEVLGLVFFGFPFVVLMIFYSYQMTELSFHQGEGSESMTGIGQRWFIKSFLLWGFIVTMMAILATLFRLIAFLFGGQDARDEALEGLEIFADENEELAAARRLAEEALKRGGD